MEYHAALDTASVRQLLDKVARQHELTGEIQSRLAQVALAVTVLSQQLAETAVLLEGLPARRHG